MTTNECTQKAVINSQTEMFHNYDNNSPKRLWSLACLQCCLGPLAVVTLVIIDDEFVSGCLIFELITLWS